MSSALSSLNLYAGVNLRAYSIVEMESYQDVRGFSKDKGFTPIWEGGVLHGGHLTIRVQVSEDAIGRLLYNGRLYNRQSWSYRPPKFIRMQGRIAKEFTSFYNNYPNKVIEVDGEPFRIRRTCDCGGRLVYDERAYLYCEQCHLIDDE